MSKFEMFDYDELLRRVGIPTKPVGHVARGVWDVDVDYDANDLVEHNGLSWYAFTDPPAGAEPGASSPYWQLADVWYCGNNPAKELTYNEAKMVYDGVAAYDGRGQGHGALCLSEDINVNGLLLNHRDRNGTIWVCTGIEGWWTLPPSEIPDVPKPYWDGSLLTTGRYLSRTITISGCFMPPDPSLVWWNRDALLRSASIVRGVGMLAVCGNEGPGITLDSAFYDPPKMAIIQMADVPLVETTKPNGFTQFSLSFRCVQPTKLSIKEEWTPLPVEDGSTVRQRKYLAFGTTFAEGDVAPTSYGMVADIPDSPAARPYSDVVNVNLGSLIPNEKYTEDGWVDNDPVIPPDVRDDYYVESDSAKVVVLHNAGNYFAFPIFVFDTITENSTDNPVTVQNITTGEEMQIIKNVPLGEQLIIDTNLRRVTMETTAGGSSDWTWNDRNALSLTSEWISLAPGDNTVVVNSGSGKLDSQPRIYWRHTWIG